MKRLVIIATLIVAAAIGAKAQTPQHPVDSVSVMLRHIANTNKVI